MRKMLTFMFLFALPLYADPKEEIKSHVANVILPLCDGWCTPKKAAAFMDLVFEVKPDVCVEIGVFGGASYLSVASALKFLGKGVIIGIDPWWNNESVKYYDPVKDHKHILWWSTLDFTDLHRTFMRTMRDQNLNEQCILIMTTSEKAAPFISREIDILYIDGHFATEASVLDVQLYLPKVRQEGYIWFNSFYSPSKQPAIDLLLDTCDLVRVIDNGNCALFQKR